MPWLWKYDPAIHYGSETTTFDSLFCQENCCHFGPTIPLHPHPNEPELMSSKPDLGGNLRGEGKGSMTVLPPRNQSELSRPQVTQGVPLPSQVDGLASTFLESEASSVPSQLFMGLRSQRSSPCSNSSPLCSKFSLAPTPIYF